MGGGRGEEGGWREEGERNPVGNYEKGTTLAIELNCILTALLALFTGNYSLRGKLLFTWEIIIYKGGYFRLASCIQEIIIYVCNYHLRM